MIRYGIIGAGFIGKKRAACLQRDQLILTHDVQPSLAESLAGKHGGKVADQVDELIHHPDIDAIIVATRHDSLALLALAAIHTGKHVLIEKPAARNPEELAPLLAAAEEHHVRVRVGYNHRFHPSLLKAREIIDSGALGPLMFLRGRYGHGGRLGYEKEWRAQPEISGGGELIDQGVHLIDLAGWFLGEFPHVHGTVATLFWKMAVDDNAFLELKTATGQIAWLHASCSEWKNLFSLEIYGRDGKLQLDGLGGSYGTEKLIHYQMQPEMGPPPSTSFEFPGDDLSWRHEMTAFEQDITEGRVPTPGLKEALATLKIVERVYHQNGGLPPERQV